MQENNGMNSGKNDLPSALQKLELAPLRNSDREIWYQAGLESGRKQTNRWRAFSAVMVVVAGMMVVWERQPGTTSPVARTEKSLPAMTVSDESTSVVSYVRLIDSLSSSDANTRRDVVGSGNGQPPRRPWPFGPGGDLFPPFDSHSSEQRG